MEDVEQLTHAEMHTDPHLISPEGQKTALGSFINNLKMDWPTLLCLPAFSPRPPPFQQNKLCSDLSFEYNRLTCGVLELRLLWTASSWAL